MGKKGSAWEDYGTPVQNSENFATYYRDGTTGLDYAKNRYYSSILGRFMTPDPSKSTDPNDPGTWNRYPYAGDDPVNSNDPSGLFPCTVGVAEGHIEIVDCEILSIDYGGGAPARVSPWDALSDTCKDALKKAVPVKNGVNGIPFWLAALKRANDAKDMLMKAADAKGIAWELLAAIGVRDVPISFCRVPLLVLSGHKKGTNPADCQSEEVEGGVASKVHTADFARTHSFGSRRQDLSPCWAVSDVTDRWRHWRVQELVLV